jgi:hypothetical protein
MRHNLRELSRKQTTGEADSQGRLPWEAFKLGCLQRIADACEKMAGNWSELIAELARSKRAIETLQQSHRYLRHSNRGLRGAITRLKRQ